MTVNCAYLKDVHPSFGHHWKRGKETEETGTPNKHGTPVLLSIPEFRSKVDDHCTHAFDSNISEFKVKTLDKNTAVKYVLAG